MWKLCGISWYIINVWPFYEWDFGWILGRWIMEILMVILRIYPLVNIEKDGTSPSAKKVNQLFSWPFSIANCNKSPPAKECSPAYD